MPIRRCLSVAALLLAATALTAADSPFGLDTTTLRKLTRGAPFRADLGNRVNFRLPEGSRYVTDDKLPEFAERMKLTLGTDEAGVVVPEDMSSYTIIFVMKEDPLAGQADLANLNKDSLMKWQEKFTADHTPRQASGGRTWTLGNWTHPTVYDADKKRLQMAVRMTAEHGDNSQVFTNYKLFVYGPEQQILCLQTIAPISAWKDAEKRTHKLADEVTFPAVFAEASGGEEMMYYAKLIGGGLIGTVMVIVLARVLMGGGRRSSPAGAMRRPGLPR